MAGKFKQCPNGHYYQGTSCPYCKTRGGNAGSITSLKTEAFVGNEASNSQIPTEIQDDDSVAKTIVIDEREEIVGGNQGRNIWSANRTVFGDEPERRQGNR